MESTNTFLVEDEVEEAAKMLQQKKKEWELDHLQSLKEAEERKNAEEEDDMFFTYVRDETYAKVNDKTKGSRTKSKSNKSNHTDLHVEVLSSPKEPESNCTSPQFQLRLQPLILKLGDDKIAQIKKTAREAIDAKNTAPVNSRVKKITLKQPVKTAESMKNLNEKKTLPSTKKTVGKTITTRKSGKSTAPIHLTEKAASVESETRSIATTQKLTATSATDHLPLPSRTRNNNAVTLKDFISTVPRDTSSQLRPSANKRTNSVTENKLSNVENRPQLKPLTSISSAASSPIASPGSSDGSSDVRRSSRTPRPKFVEDDWFLFS